ncbi:hypothetical protein WDU94_000286 [Cyamophila willieti]
MVSMKQICKFLEMTGLFNLHRHKSRWTDHLQNIYVSVQMGLFLSFLLCQLYSVLTRAVRYFPECLQSLLENLICWYLIIYAASCQFRYEGLNYLIDQVENTFSKADTRIIQKYHRLTKLVSVSLLIALCIATFTLCVETFLSISPDELEIRRFVYRTAHPERKLPMNLRIPFLDETKSWTYEILYAISIYLFAMYSMWVGLLASMMPTTMMHLRGQYEILCKYIVMIGQTHRDYVGNLIVYINIEKNEFVLESTPPVKRKPRQMKMKRIWKQKQKAAECYQQNFVRQIIRFHQRLITFQNEVSTLEWFPGKRAYVTFFDSFTIAGRRFLLFSFFQSRRGFYPPGVGQTNQLILTSPSTQPEQY